MDGDGEEGVEWMIVVRLEKQLDDSLGEWGGNRML